MKKLIVIILVAMVPFLTMAQKRSKKDKGVSKNVTSYMVIKGIEVSQNPDEEMGDVGLTDKTNNERRSQMKSILKGNTQFLIHFDSGGQNHKEERELMKNNNQSMVAALNAASKKGWEFISANVLKDGEITTHYYYMKR
mgnify:FL=1